MHLPSDYIYPYRCVGGNCSQRRAPTRGRSRRQVLSAPPILEMVDSQKLRCAKASVHRSSPLALGRKRRSTKASMRRLRGSKRAAITMAVAK
jgi:hypothetical protein